MTDIKQAIQELKPCPFCGGTPTIRQDIVKYSDEDVWIIECRHNGCLMGPEIENPNSIEAIAAWNTRSAVDGGTVEECIDCKNLESTIDKLYQRLTTAIDDEATRIKRWAQASAIYRFDPERKEVVADGKQGNLIELQTVEQICDGTHGYSGKYEPDARPMWSPTPDLSARIEAAAEEIAKQADEVWPSLRCDNCGSFVLLRNIPEDGYDCQGCSNFTRTPDEVIGITKNDLEKLSTAIITRHIEGGGK